MDMLDHALRSKLPNARYAYVAPYYVQAKSVAWDYLKAFARPVLTNAPNESELRVDLVNGARISLYGGDNGDRLRGLALDGVILDEFADMPASLWGQVIRPALTDRRGWATIIGTVKGKNQLWQAYEAALEQPQTWYSHILKASETGILDSEELADARRGMTAEEYAAEFECDPLAAIMGAYFGKEMAEADKQGRICAVPYDPSLKVHTAWDLGIGDSTAIWFFQLHAGEIRIIDHYEANGFAIPHYVSELASRGYDYGDDYVPHDARVRSLETGRTRVETLISLGRKPKLVASHKIMDGINAARLALPKCYFDAFKCKDGIEALRQYRAEYDDKVRAFKDTPKHDWCFTGDTKVLTRHGMQQMMNLPKTGEVLTTCGWSKYRNPRVTRKSAPLVEVVFNDGLTVKCTPDHLFKTVSGWKSAESLAKGTQIQSSLTLSRSISRAVSTVSGRVKGTCRAAVRSCIETYGPQLLGQSPRDAISTTGTTTRQITSSPIWSAWTARNISLRHGLEHGLAKNVISATMLDTRPQTGTSQKLGDFGTADTPSGRSRGLSGFGKRNHARNAASSFRRWFGSLVTARYSVRSGVRPLRIASVRPLNETADVWCLTVPDAEEFSLSNGAVVHNCSHTADAFRYLTMAYREIVPLPAPEPPKPVKGIGDYNVEEMWSFNKRPKDRV